MRRIIQIWKTAGNDVKVLYGAIVHQDRPVWLIPALVLVAIYTLNPFNFAVPLLGIVDDAVIVPLALHFLVLRLPASLRGVVVR
ncbi:conserved hypothetical protein [Burkholderia diffusa]|nr:conserved hypothetical protein [Burkholderia diffusa]